MGLFIDKTQKHLIGIRTLAIVLEIVIFSCIVLIPLGNLYVTLILGAFLGFFTVPILPSSYAFAAKITPGMAPAVVNGLMMSGAQLYSFFGSLIITWLLNYGQRSGLS
jgi:MFS family permease